jgi:hypothetical protein
MPANAPATVLPIPDLSGSKLDAYADDLLSRQSAALFGSTVAKFRWYPAGKPPSQKIMIVACGSKRKTKAICKTGKLSHLYPSWEPVLEEWTKRHATVKRQKLSELPAGEFPQER